MLAMCATVIGFVLGCFFGFVAGYFRGSWPDKLASFLAVVGVSSWLLARTLTRPLRELSRAAREFGAGELEALAKLLGR